MLTIIYVPILLSILYINTNGISLGQILEQINDRILPKVTDKFAFMGNSLIFMVLGVVTLIRLKCMSSQMIEVQEYFSRYATLTTDGIRRLMIKCYFRLIPLILIMVGSYAFAYLGIFYDLMALLGLSSIETAMIVTSGTILTLFFIMPVIYFQLVYVEVCFVHKNWCDTLLNMKAEYHLIEESRNFINGIKMVSKMFSSFLFWTTSMLFFSIIVNAYVAISQFFKLSFDDMELGGIMLVTGQFLSCFFVGYFLFILGNISEVILTSIQELKSTIQNVYYQNNQADCITSMLDDFKGFDANGYFTLNHSMLTGMITNFATFLVILVQFNQSEPSKPDQLE